MMRMKKRLAGLVLTLALMLGLCAMPAAAAGAVTYGDWTYEALDNSTARITAYGGSATAVAVPATLNGYRITRVGASAFQNSNVTRVVVPEGVTMISRLAFSGCSKLSDVYLPSTLVSVQMSAFQNCSGLQNVFFGGTAEKWNGVIVGDGNTALTQAAAVHEMTASSFGDVSLEAWYFNPVSFAVSRGITAGVGENLFGPENVCTRAAIVTFLWNRAGKPQPTSNTNPFVDVSSDAWYYNAVLWAVEQGITAGTGEDTFSPDAECTRAQAVTLLYNEAGKPAASGTTSAFSDVSRGTWYYNAVLWATSQKITAGMGNGIFGTDYACTRGQIVTFLWNQG